MKKIIILTHTDLDGAAFPYFLTNLTRTIEDMTNEKYEIEIKYGDINNASKIMNNDFDKLKSATQNELEQTYYLALDIGNIGEMPEIKTLIDEMRAKGLKFSYIDHHPSLNSDNMDKEMEYMYYSTDKSMCASMMSFAATLQCCSDKCGSIDINRYVESFDIKDKVTERLMIDNLINTNKTEKSSKFEYQKELFSNMFSLDKIDINDKQFKKRIADAFQFMRATDYLDRGKIKEMDGLPLVTDYLNLFTEHTNQNIHFILKNIEQTLNSDAGSQKWNDMKNAVDELRQKYKLQDRIDQSLDSMEFIKVKGDSGKIYNFGVCFAESDIRYSLEAKRFEMDKVQQERDLPNEKIDALITATRFSIGKTAIMTMKPCSPDGNSVAIAQDTFIDKSKILGTNAGIPIEYSNEIYETLVNNRKQGRSGIDIFLNELKKTFDFEELYKKRENKGAERFFTI